MHELRAGSPYHIVSGVLDAGPGTARLGHKLFNSETGELSATHLQDYSGSVAKEPIEWPDEKPIEAIDFDSLETWSPTAANVVHPRDLDHSGRMSLSTLIHYGSDANVQFQNRIGMTSSYMHENLIGFATMAYHIELGRASARARRHRRDRIGAGPSRPQLAAHRPSRARRAHPRAHRHAGPVRRPLRPPGPPPRRDPQRSARSPRSSRRDSPFLSSPGEPKARPGDPVLTRAYGDYWVARSSRAMTTMKVSAAPRLASLPPLVFIPPIPSAP
jgi:hypothetical protein